jgi:hypothetical protein
VWLGGRFNVGAHHAGAEGHEVSTFASRLYQMAKEYAAARAGWGVLLVASFSMNRFPIRARALAASRSDVMKKIVIGIAVSAAPLGASALAADLEVKAPPAIPYSVWSGPYLGISGGARYNAVDGNVTSATVGTPPNSITLPPVIPGPNNWRPGAMQFIDNIAFRPGVYGGWTFQVTPSYIIGLEADFAYVKETSVFHGSAYPTNLGEIQAPNRTAEALIVGPIEIETWLDREAIQ